MVDQLYNYLFQKNSLDPQQYTHLGDSLFWVRFSSLQVTKLGLYLLSSKAHPSNTGAADTIDPFKHSTMHEGQHSDHHHQHGAQHIHLKEQIHDMEQLLERLIPTMIVRNGGVIAEMIPAPKVMPVYFPQYHSIPENDQFWGKDFTEWTLLKPVVTGPRDIHKPLPESEGGLGYYNLTNIEVRRKQALLAHHAGIHAFVYYHYWFVGPNTPPGHKVMYRIPEMRMADGEPDLPFALSWANEPW